MKVCVCAFYVPQSSSVQLGSSEHSPSISSMFVHKQIQNHIMLKLLPKIYIALEKIHVLKSNVVTKMILQSGLKITSVNTRIYTYLQFK